MKKKIKNYVTFGISCVQNTVFIARTLFFALQQSVHGPSSRIAKRYFKKDSNKGKN